jgi:putative SOS response-associated peptidase YedK
MCGRYALTSPPEVIAQRFNLLWVPELLAHYNIAPSQMIPVVRNMGQGRELALHKWGLIPSWAKDPAIGFKLINARAETLADKPAFRSAYRRRHCLIPADAFYEWKPIAGRKQPYCIRMADQTPFAMAGLWEHWANPVGQAVETCTIITTNANTLVGDLHNRMPVILAPDDYAAWLDPGSAKAQELLKPFPPERMTVYPVSLRVNNVKNDDAECLAPLAR